MSTDLPVIVAELVMPGLSHDLSTWVCSIDADGRVRQEVSGARGRRAAEFFGAVGTG